LYHSFYTKDNILDILQGQHPVFHMYFQLLCVGRISVALQTSCHDQNLFLCCIFYFNFSHCMRSWSAKSLSDRLSSLSRCGHATSAVCECRQQRTMHHIVNMWLLTKFEVGLQSLCDVEDDVL